MPITLGDTSITSSTGKVGIGSGFTPATGLHAQSSTVEADRSLRLSFDATFFSEIRQLGAGGMGFRNNSVDNLMAIDGSGRVTKPFQPAFHAIGANAGGGQFFSNVNVGDQVVYNRGNNYSSSTKRFTAPVAGVYCFSAGALKYSSNTMSLQFTINASITNVSNYAEGASGNQVSSISAELFLNAGDFVVAFCNAGSWYDNGPGNSPYNWFSGALIG